MGFTSVLAAGPGGASVADTPLTLAETASGFRRDARPSASCILGAETDPARRKALLAGKVEDMLNTVVRQIAFYEFERRVHDGAPVEGELTAEAIGEIWMDRCRAMTPGPGVYHHG